jgi:hypothetical protein
MATLHDPSIRTRLSRYTSHHPMDRLKLYIRCAYTVLCVSALSHPKIGRTVISPESFFFPFTRDRGVVQRSHHHPRPVYFALWKMVKLQSKDKEDNREDKRRQTRKQSITNLHLARFFFLFSSCRRTNLLCWSFQVAPFLPSLKPSVHFLKCWLEN